MAYCPGETLRDRILRGPLSRAEVSSILEQIARALIEPAMVREAAAATRRFDTVSDQKRTPVRIATSRLLADSRIGPN
jgi:hypothetical protein